jgi:hypothetical protein
MHVDEHADFKAMGQSRRSLTGQVRAAGKGDDLRPAAVDDRTLAKNWCRTLGHKWVDGLDECANGCGKKSK